MVTIPNNTFLWPKTNSPPPVAPTTWRTCWTLSPAKRAKRKASRPAEVASQTQWVRLLWKPSVLVYMVFLNGDINWFVCEHILYIYKYIYIHEIIGLYAYIVYIYMKSLVYTHIYIWNHWFICIYIYIYKVILYGNTRCVYGRGRVFSTNHTYGP